MSMGLKLEARTRCNELCTTILLNFAGTIKKFLLYFLPPRNPKTSTQTFPIFDPISDPIFENNFACGARKIFPF